MSQSPWPPPIGEVSNGHQWNGSQWVPLAPQVGQVANGHRWDGRQWVPVAPPVPPVGTVQNGYQWDGRQWVPLAPPVGAVANGHRWDGRQWVPLQPPPPPIGQVVNGYQWDGRQWVPLAQPVDRRPEFQVLPELRRLADAWQLEWHPVGQDVRMLRVVAEQRAFLATTRLEYHATVTVDEGRRELAFVHFLAEAGAAAPTGGAPQEPGEVPRSPGAPGPDRPTESIEEQAARLGRTYPLDFRYDLVRDQVRGIAEAAGYAFRYGVPAS